MQAYYTKQQKKTPPLCFTLFCLIILHLHITPQFHSSIPFAAFFFFTTQLSLPASSSMAHLSSPFTILCLLLLQYCCLAASAPPLLGSNGRHSHSHSRPHLRHRTPLLQANLSSCSLFVGSWVVDETYPLYQPSDCPAIIDAEFNCQMYGRPDTDYLKYRWKPANCDIPR